MELIGRRFGHIRVTEVVGEGGMGDVYGGFDETLERKVALKVLNADQRLDDDARERLLREARALSKLEHPNICRIHDYIESGDVDLLVLEYIDGRTLFDMMGEKVSRAEKLRIAIAIAQVLVIAHREGILHRDLKPENVMLTKSGEVKVLDFGLARWFHRGRMKSTGRHAVASAHVAAATSIVHPAAATLPFAMRGVVPISSRRGPVNTAVGITLGTPLYMSPEQARGETLTPASDLFSFGLLLQMLFTGKEAHPIEVTGREAILRVSSGHTLPVDGAPGDITALINRLKQFAPADRPTAVETLDRLRDLANKPQRFARRGIAAAMAMVLLVGGWRYMVDLRAERVIAVAKTAEAEKRRAEVEDLLEFMLGDLRKKLEPVGRLDILDDVGKRALHYADSLHPEVMSADELLRNAKALNQLGGVRVQQGKLDESLLVFRKSVRLAELAVTRDAASAPARLVLATAHFWVGDVYRRQGKAGDALRHYTKYMTIAEQLAKSHPGNDEYQLERAYGHSNVASIYELQGDLPRALEHLRLTLEVKDARLAVKPSDAGRQADRARTVNRIGLVMERSGDLVGARAHYESEFATYSRLTTSDPRNSQWKARLVVSHNYLARIVEMTGDLDRAIELRRAELRLITQLVDRDPANTTWQRNLAMAQMKYGDVLRLKGQSTLALVTIKDAQKTMQHLLSRTETVASWRRDLGNVQTAMARARLATGDTVAAERDAKTAIHLLTPFAGTEALMPRYIADAWLALGDARAAAVDSVRAREAWTMAEQVLAPLARESRSPEVLDVMVRILLKLGRRDEAAALIGQLQRIGYREPDFERAIL